MKNRLKKIIVCALTVIIFVMAMSPAVSAAEVYFGDVNFDGKVTASDARAVLRYAATIDAPDEYQKIVADVNGDGRITSADARFILRISAKMETMVMYSGEIPDEYLNKP